MDPISWNNSIESFGLTIPSLHPCRINTGAVKFWECSLRYSTPIYMEFNSPMDISFATRGSSFYAFVTAGSLHTPSPKAFGTYISIGASIGSGPAHWVLYRVSAPERTMPSASDGKRVAKQAVA